MSENPRINIDNTELSLTRVTIVIVFLLGVGWAFISTVVLPINTLNLEFAQLNTTLTTFIKTQNQSYTLLQTEVNQNTSDISIIKEHIGIK